MLETAESQNFATVEAINHIPETSIKQITKSPGNQDVLENDLLTFSSSHGESKDRATTEQITESSSTQEVLGHLEFSFNSHSIPSSFVNENATDDSETKSSNNQNVSTKQEHPSNSTTINGSYNNSDSMRKHVTANSSVQGEILHNDPSGVTSPSANGNFSDEVTTAKDVTTSSSTQSDPAKADSLSDEISSWLLPPSGLDDPWNEETPSNVATKYKSVESEKATEETTTQQDSYALSPPEYYGKPEQDNDKSLNWGGYEDWWAKTYANHRPYYTDEQLKFPEENEKLLDSITIWNMDSFRQYEGSKVPVHTDTATNTSMSKNASEITESYTSMSALDNQEREDADEHHSSKHSVKKANPQNLYSDKQVKIEGTKSEPEQSSNKVLLAGTSEDILPGAHTPMTEGPVETKQFLEPSTEQSDENLIESTLAQSGIKETPHHSLTTEPNLLTTSTEIVTAPSSTENILSTEHETDNPSYSETNQTLYHNEHSTERSEPLPSGPNIKRTDTRSLMARILGTRTSTKISHETEICYRGRCIKTKTKESDIDQSSTD
jgi:hypothetical protein